MAPHVRARMIRSKLAADWTIVHRMLTDPKAPRRDAQGRDVYEVWADLVLANPAVEFARVVNDILPKDLPDAQATPMLTSIQNLYLTAVQQANKPAEPKTIEHAHDVPSSDNDW